MSATEERHSPGWRKPSEVMKKRKQRKARQSVGDLPTDVRPPSRSSPQRPGIVLKRRNPFGCGGAVSARRRISSDVGLSAPREQEKLDNEVSKSQGVESILSSLSDGEKQPEMARDGDKIKKGKNKDEEENPESTEQQSCQRSSSCPIDWCLHTRVRFTSQTSFDWSNRISSSEESHGLTNYVLCRHEDRHLQQGKTSSEESIFRQRLKQSTMVWSSPSLPWFKTFPRIVPELRDTRTSFVVKEEKVEKALMAQWYDSFCSVYQLLRSEICPYFYVCAHHLTILLRAKHVAGHRSIHALLGPTTRGFRESLKVEGVTFTMPLLQTDAIKHQDPHQVVDDVTENTSQDSTSFTQEINSEREEDEEAKDADDESDAATASWLESVGLENLIETNSHRVQMRSDPTVKQDNRPQSLLFVEGLANVQALYNFVLNYKNIVATVGPQAGIPPTILAPMAFHGATLTCNKIKSGSMRQIVGQRIHDVHTLEVSGPMLPHSVDLLVNLLSETQQGQFSMAFQAHEPTASFSSGSHKLSSELEDEPSSASNVVGLRKEFAERLYSRKHVLQKAWKDLKFLKGQYEWTQNV